MLPALILLVFASGCGHLHKTAPEMVYVSAQESFLRDRVAAVSTRVAKVENGEPLVVLEHARRFLRVRTPENQTGWIEDHMVIGGPTYAAFMRLAAEHKNDPVTATATLNDELYMHLAPGRETDHFYLLPANTKVQLLERASVPRIRATPYAPAARPAQAKPGQPGKTPVSETETEAPPEMEDWWLVRDSQGRTGWMLGSRLYVDVPDAIEQYGEGQLFVGAWQIATVNDPESDAPNHQVPEYLTVLAPPKSGLPFDFNQVRVFTWSRIHHRYETGFRLHPIQGFLPVKIFSTSTPKDGVVPAFSFELGSGDVVTDPATGITRPAAPRTIEYEMIDTQVKRIGPDTAPIQTLHEDDRKDAKAKRKRR